MHNNYVLAQEEERQPKTNEQLIGWSIIKRLASRWQAAEGSHTSLE
jgi:hypothetical protein